MSESIIKKQPKKVKIPNKKTMNLYVEEKDQNSTSTIVKGLIIAGICGFLLFSFLIVKKLNELNKLRNEVNNLETEVLLLNTKLNDYSKTRENYLRYTDSYYQGNVKLVDRMSILDYLDEAMDELGSIKYVSISTNKVSLSVQTKSLEDLKLIKKRLEKNQYIDNVSVHTASYSSSIVTSSVTFDVLNIEED